MAQLTKADLDAVIRKRRVKSLHRWFAALQRSVNKPALLEGLNAPKYAPAR